MSAYFAADAPAVRAPAPTPTIPRFPAVRSVLWPRPDAAALPCHYSWRSTYTPFLAAPLSSTPTSCTATSFTNGNLRIDVDAATGFFAATRVSDGLVVQRMTNLTFGPPAARGRFPSSLLEFQGHAQGETLVGMGEQGTRPRVALEQPFERVFIDTEYYRLNQGRQALLPLYFSSAGYGLMLAQPGYGWLRVDAAPNMSAYSAESSATIDLWVTTTPGTPEFSADAPHPLLALLAQYGDAVGYAPPMPFFASGFLASKDRYHNQSQLLAVAHGYVDRGIPMCVALGEGGVAGGVMWARTANSTPPPRGYSCSRPTLNATRTHCHATPPPHG